MTDITERLHVIRAHLRTGAVGQRDVWKRWLTEASAEISRLRTDYGILKDDYDAKLAELATCRELRQYDRVELTQAQAQLRRIIGR